MQVTLFLPGLLSCFLVKRYFGFKISAIFLCLLLLTPSEYSLALMIQSVCIPLWIYGAHHAYLEKREKWKYALYALLGIIAAVSVIAAINSVILFFVLYGFLFFLDRSKRLKSVLFAGTSIAAFALSALLMVAFLGKPSVDMTPLADKVFAFMPTTYLDEDVGLSAKRLIALNAGEEKWVLSAQQKELDAYLNTKETPLINHSEQCIEPFAKLAAPERSMILSQFASAPCPTAEHILQASRARRWGGKMAQKGDFAGPASFAIGSIGHEALFKGLYKEAILKYPFSFLQHTFQTFILAFAAFWPLWAFAACAFLFALKSRRKIILSLFSIPMLFVLCIVCVMPFSGEAFQAVRPFVTLLAATGIYQIFILIRYLLQVKVPYVIANKIQPYP